MASFPGIQHVAITVRDLSVSVPWYEALLDAKPALDEDADPGSITPSTWSATTGSSSDYTSTRRRRRRATSASSA